MIFFSPQKSIGRSVHNTVLKFLIPYHTPNIVILFFIFVFLICSLNHHGHRLERKRTGLNRHFTAEPRILFYLLLTDLIPQHKHTQPTSRGRFFPPEWSTDLSNFLYRVLYRTRCRGVLDLEGLSGPGGRTWRERMKKQLEGEEGT